MKDDFCDMIGHTHTHSFMKSPSVIVTKGARPGLEALVEEAGGEGLGAQVKDGREKVARHLQR